MTKPQTTICPEHQNRETPLITTFAFPGAEYWCPHCGYICGMFDGAPKVPTTPELEATAKADREKGLPYLRSLGTPISIPYKYEVNNE